MKLLRSIRGKMFIAYASLLLALIVMLFFLYYRHSSAMLSKNAAQSLQQLSINTSQNLDFFIKGLDSTASKAVSSSLFKEAFYQDISSFPEQLENQYNLTHILFNITAFNTDYAVNVLGENKKLLEYGKKFDLSIISDMYLQKLLPELQKGYSARGKFYISSTPLLPYTDLENYGFSVCRSMNRILGDEYNACVEVQADYQRLAKLLDASVMAEKTRILLYDEHGNLLYPKDGPDNAAEYFHSIPSQEHSGTFTFSAENSSEFAAYQYSSYSKCTLLALQNEDQLYLPVRTFQNRLIIITGLTLLLTAFIASLLARQLTRPIYDLQKSIMTLDLNQLSPNELLLYEPSTYELAALRDSYVEMITRLRSSLDETVTAHSREIHARMLALQAQMNPHFLYNTITIISARAEEYESEDVVEMCESLVSMLRYVTWEASGTVTLHQEIQHLESYLYLMKCRYPEQFSSTISVPKEMYTLRVPKLILQPLAENSFKHGFKSRTLWEIHIKGKIDENCWELAVIDNGTGFSSDSLDNLETVFQTTDTAFEYTDTTEDGVGLPNIFHRLYFLYKDESKFTIENLPQGGCRITIGGPCNFGDKRVRF